MDLKQHIKGPSTQRGGGLVRVGLILAISIVTSGCGWFQEPPVFSIVNETDEILHLISINSDGLELELAVLEPGGRYEEPLGPGQCNNTPLVTRRANGSDFAREPDTMCAGDEWIITGADS
jgi:hypothetical protein